MFSMDGVEKMMISIVVYSPEVFRFDC